MSVERLESLRRDMKKCVRCSLCKLIPMPTVTETRFISACPPIDAYHFHAYSGGGIQVMALSLLDGRIEADQDLARIVAACTTCGLCDVACKFIMSAERHDVIMALKEHLVECGLALPEQRLKHDNLIQFGHTAGEPSLSPGKWADGLAIKRLPTELAPILLFAGSGAGHDPNHARSARKLAQLLQLAGVDFGTLAENEPDAGMELYWTGQGQTFKEQARRVSDLFRQSGARTVATLCGEDLGLFRAVYPAYGHSLEAEVVHASEFLLELIESERLQLTQPIPCKVTYHDPCYLGRRSEPVQDWQGEERLTHGVMTYHVPPKTINYGVNGVFDAPRQILRHISGMQLVEMHRIREYAYCCGGGGGVPDTHPDVASSAALQRLAEAESTGAELVVTACQHCRQNLARWSENESLPVAELVDIVHQAAGLDPEPTDIASRNV